MDNRLLLKYFVTLAFALAVFTGLIKYKKSDRLTRMFFYYLLYGFLTDILTSPIFKFRDDVKGVFFVLYGLVESTFLFYFLGNIFREKYLKKIAFYLSIAALPAWVVLYLFLKNIDLQVATYDTFYNIVIALLSAFALIEMAEIRKDLGKIIYFWFVLATFIFSFCTFFINLFFHTAIGNKIWYLQNAINLIAYILFIIGFTRSTVEETKLQNY